MRPNPIPFAAFIAATQNASLSALRQGSNCRVRDAAAFAEILAYLLERYRDVVVVRSLLVDSQTFDCVASPNPQTTPSGMETGCPAGTVPMRRITLEEMVRFETLRDFLRKAPGSGLPPII